MIGKEFLKVLIPVGNVGPNSQQANSIVLTLQYAIWNSALDKFTVWSFVIVRAVTRAYWGCNIIGLASTSIYTKH
jgi:hypothetical protein